MEPMTKLDGFFVTHDGLLYTPDCWYDRQGYLRNAYSEFVLTSYVRNYDRNYNNGYAIPLNPLNLEDIYAKLPDMEHDHPLSLAIARRCIELEYKRRAMNEAEQFKADEGMTENGEAEIVEKVTKHLFTNDAGEGFGPTIEEEVKRMVPDRSRTSLGYDSYNPPGRGWYYQQEAGIRLVDRLPSFLAAMQQRVGKTPTFVVGARRKYENDDIDIVVIVSTRRLLRTAWKDEIDMYWPRAEYTILENDKTRQDFIEREYDVVMTSFESLHKNWPLIRMLHDPSRIMIVADETIKIKSPRSRRTQAMWAACSEARYRYLLSGAPVSRLHADLFPQIFCIDPGLFGLDYSNAERFFFWNTGDGQTRFRRNRKHLFHQIADLAVWRCTRGESEQFKGRETVTINERLPFDPIQLQCYKDLLRNYVAEYLSEDDDGGAYYTSATNILVQLGRLREICGGFLSYETEPGKYERIRLPRNPKINWLRQFFEDHEATSAIVFCEYNEEEEQIGDLFDEIGIKWGGLLKVSRERADGVKNGSKDDQFADHVHDFQDGKLQVFVGKHSSIGHGLTLNAADVEIFYSLGFNSDNYDQARMRAVGGDTGCVLVYHLMMGGSIEETKIYRALSSRQDMKAGLLKDLNRRGYHEIFKEMELADLLVEELDGLIVDFLEEEARKILGYEGPLTEDALEAFANRQGMDIFALVKKTIGASLSLKDAYTRCMRMFHPDRAIALGHERGSKMYLLYEQIAKSANKAKSDSLSLGGFVGLIGGKEPDANWQKWYDYLLRKARAAGYNPTIVPANRRIA